MAWALFLANLAPFLAEIPLKHGPGALWASRYGIVPALLLKEPVRECPHLLTGMFIHGSISHLAGNLFFLYIFGIAVEDQIGPWRLLGLYLTVGLAAGFAQVLAEPTNQIPLIGASGAISGLIGVQLIVQPGLPIAMLSPLFLLWKRLVFDLPVWLVAAQFFFVQGFSAVGEHSGEGGNASTVNVAGLVLGILLSHSTRLTRPRNIRFTYA